MSEKSAFEAFARMEERIETTSASSRNVEIEEEFSGDKLASDFKELEKGAGAAAADAAAARAQAEDGHAPCGRAASNKQIGAGGSNEEIAHAEIEDAPDEQKKLP